MKRTTIRGRRNSKVALISHDGGYDVVDKNGKIVAQNEKFLTALKIYGKHDAPNRRK